MSYVSASGILSKIYQSSLIPVRTHINVPIKWKKPTKPPWYDKSMTGDGVDKHEVDMSKTPLIVEKSEEIKTASDEVKKLFTFHFMGRKHAMKRALIEMVDSVKQHKYDNNSIPTRIAAKTAIIRNLLEHLRIVGKDCRASMYTKEQVERRHKLLNDLRKYDYKHFEWIIEKLDLYYVPRPEVFDLVEKRKSIKKLTDMYCEDYKQRKLDAYRQQLFSQRTDFLNDKVKILEFLRNEEIECGVTPTITEDHINQAKQQLQDHIDNLPKEEEVQSRNILMDV